MANELNINTGVAAGERLDSGFLVSGYLFLTKYFTVKSGQDLLERQIVALETATDKIVAYDENGSGGHETAYGIMMADADATAGDVKGSVLIMGTVNSNKTFVAGSGSVDEQKIFDELRARGIFLVGAMALL